ncbi:protein of unknown function [Paenibacillus alvei]|uniref:Uncharacterized protein n=1 Tax=Paenibacillus alvei TaxID=44250 RepID=A0A383RH56_PAEAL|nr:protein of unknown function [Paenibacillus alvei]
MSQVRVLFGEPFALIAQSVECIHGKDEVTGSIPVESSTEEIEVVYIDFYCMARWSRG